MKNRIIILNFLLLTSFFLNFSCKKKESTTDAPVAANTLCDGNKTTTWYPLVSGDYWEYNYYISSASQPSTTLSAGGTKGFGSNTYVIVDNNNDLMYGYHQYYREDATTHSIYQYDNDVKYKEFLLVPGSPVLNQSWTYISTTRTVTNLSATYTTGKCTYTGLLEITEGVSKYYYKKGLGVVAALRDFGDKFEVKAVTLK